MPDVTASYGKLFDFIALLIDNNSCLKYCIFTKLSQIECLINEHILQCHYVKCDCLLWITCLKLVITYNFIKLLQIVC